MPEQIKMPENSKYLQKIKTPGKNKTPAMLDEAPRSETSHQLPRAVLHPSVLAPWHCHHHQHHHNCRNHHHYLHMIFVFITIVTIALSCWCCWQGESKRCKERDGLDWNSINVSSQGCKNFPHKIFIIFAIHHCHPRSPPSQSLTQESDKSFYKQF